VLDLPILGSDINSNKVKGHGDQVLGFLEGYRGKIQYQVPKATLSLYQPVHFLSIAGFFLS
jgi:hypothetical protein